MRTVFEEEEEDVAQHERRPDSGQDRELTISSTTLLAIFFGLVLICGLFFGLGYSLGRRTTSESAQLPSDPGASVANAQTSGSLSKPSAASQPAEASTSTPASGDADATDTSGSAPTSTTAPEDPTSEASHDATPVSAPESKTVPPAAASKQQSPAQSTTPPSTQSAASSTPALATSSSVPPSAIMVQIAAISNPADADVLVRALAKHGYSVATRRVPGDSLIHVQVGPFTNRADAVAMRQKLLSDGYNAILK